MSKKVTVVLPTLNREPFLLNAIEDLLQQTESEFDILIVDQSDQPSQKILDLQKIHPQRINYHHVKFRGLPVARNYAWQKATGDIVLFLDDDIRCGPRIVSQHVHSFSSPDVAVVAGGIDEANKYEDPNPKQVGTFSYWTATPERGFQAHRATEVQHVPGGNFSVRRSLFAEIGGFDEAFSRGTALYEETDFCLRAIKKGYRILFNPEARLTHLAASAGGCRVPQLAPYLRSLSRNRTMIILRYLSWYQRPIAMLRLIILNLSYARSQRNPTALFSGLLGAWEGFSERRNLPVVTTYE